MTAIEVAVGRIAKAHGVRGEVAIDVLTDEPERRFELDAVFVARAPRRPEQSLTLEAVRWHQERLLARFVEVPDRTAAEGVRGLVLHVTLAEDEVPDEDDAYYDHQLEGLRVVDTEGVEHGTVAEVRHGAQDLLVVDTDRGQVLVPFVAALVPEVDLEGGLLVVEDRPGLLRPDEAEEGRA